MLSVFVPFDHAKDFIRRLLGLQISKRFLQSAVYGTGEKFAEYFQKPLTGDEYAELLSGEAEPPELAYCFIDGAMTPVLETDEKTGKKCLKYRENKLGLIVDAADCIKTRDKAGRQTLRLRKKKFVTSLAAGVEPFKSGFKKLATITGALQSDTVVLITDGAEWIRGVYQEIMPNAVRILDWYHAMEHLWDAARQRFGEGARDKIHNWVKPIESLLFAGEISQALHLIKECAQSSKEPTPFWNLYRYYYKNRHAMKYKEFRERGYLIGSGPVESANKYIISSRLKLAGCRWKVDNGNSMTWLRCKYFEDDWDAFWEKMNYRQFSEKGLSLSLAA